MTGAETKPSVQLMTEVLGRRPHVLASGQDSRDFLRMLGLGGYRLRWVRTLLELHDRLEYSKHGVLLGQRVAAVQLTGVGDAWDGVVVLASLVSGDPRLLACATLVLASGTVVVVQEGPAAMVDPEDSP